ncbi:MAG: tetratricopeptide repeat protein, partial [Acidobacteriaceae bacterium]|nr:tetratricopeptide repeat protein [Acidobacteriaceae bacterium]
MKYLLALSPVGALLFLTACSQSPEKLISVANKYHQQKKYKEASILYQKAIAKDKKNAEAYYREGLNLLDDRNPVQAVQFLRRAVDLKPDNTDAEAKLAEIYLEAYSSNPNKFKALLPEVRDLTQKILQRQPNSFNGTRLQALVYLADKDKDKALEWFAKANQIKPYSREVVGWYAEALMSVGRADAAEALLRDMLAHDKSWDPGYDLLFVEYNREKQRDKAEAILRERVQNEPTSTAAVQNLGNYLAASGRPQEGEAVLRRAADDRKDFPNGHELLGDFYFRSKKFDLALQQYQAGVNEDPKNALRYQQRVIAVYTITGKHDQAVALAKKLAASNPKDAASNEMYASLLLQTGMQSDTSKSISELKDLVKNNPGNPILHVDLARAYFALRDTDKALSEALEASHLAPKAIPPRIIAARVYEDRGEHGKALEQTDVILVTEPRNPEGRLVRARALIGINQADKAQPELEALVNEFPNLPDPRLQLGDLYLLERQYDKAAQEYERIWKADPPDTRGFIGLQQVKVAEGHADEAIRALQDLVNKNPKDLAFRFELANFEATGGGQVLRSDPGQAKQLFEQAADNYKEILKTNTNSVDVWLRLGALQRQLGQFDAALASFEQAGTADPHNPAPFLNRAMLFEALGKQKEAVDGYNKVLGIDPQNALALNNLAFLNAESGTNLDQAMTYAERAKKQFPNNPDITDTLGYVYYQKHLNSEAVRMFRHIVQDHPQNSMFHLHLAMALSRQGDKDGA